MKRGGSGANLASCLVAAIFLVFLVFVLLVVFFTLFRPQNPGIGIHGVEIPVFSIRNDSLSFTLSVLGWVHNPNRASSFGHYDSTAQLLFAGNQAGFMFIPAGSIDAGRTQLMTITFFVKGFPLSVASSGNFRSFVASPVTIEVEIRMRMTGRVKVLHFFRHHTESTVGCRVFIDERNGSVLGFNC